MINNFELELSYIKNCKIKTIAEQGVALLPDYFYHIPASSTGKWHPKYALGDGGLYRHVKATIVIARELFNNNQFRFSQNDKDLIIASLLLHDGWKKGIVEGEHTKFKHPNIASTVLWGNIKTNSILEKYYLGLICLNILSHMGQWQKDKYEKGKLLRPITKMQKFVHLVDYLASRKSLEVNFE